MRNAVKYKTPKGYDDSKPHKAVCEECGKNILCRKVYRRNHGEKKFDVYDVCFTCIPEGKVPGVITKTVLATGESLMKLEKLLNSCFNTLADMQFKLNRIEKAICENLTEEKDNKEDLKKIRKGISDAKMCSKKIRRIKSDLKKSGFGIKSDVESNMYKILKNKKVVGRFGMEKGEVFERKKVKGKVRFDITSLYKFIEKHKGK